MIQTCMRDRSSSLRNEPSVFWVLSILIALSLSGARAFGQERPDLLWMTSGARSGKVAFSPDGRFLASGGGIWCVTNRLLVRTVGSPGESTAWSADGTLVASGRGHAATLWRFADGTRLQTVLVTNALIQDIALSSDGSLLAGGMRGGYWDWDEEVWVWEDDWASPGEVWVWRTSDGTLLRQLSGHDEEVTAIAFSPTDDLLASVSRDETAILWRPSTGERLRTLGGFSDGSGLLDFLRMAAWWLLEARTHSFACSGRVMARWFARFG